MPRRTKAEAEATREALLDAAEELFLTQGVSHTSLEQIARRAGMTRGAVYWHFRNKAALFDAMIDRVKLPLKQLIADLENPDLAHQPLEGIKQAFKLAFARFEQPRYQRVYTILFYRCESTDELNPSARQNALIRESFDHMVTLLKQAQQNNQLKTQLAAPCTARLLHLTMLGLVHDWLRDPTQYAIRDEGNKVVDALFSLITRDATDLAAPDVDAAASTERCNKMRKQ